MQPALYRPCNDPLRYVRATVMNGKVDVPRLATVKSTNTAARRDC